MGKKKLNAVKTERKQVAITVPAFEALESLVKTDRLAGKMSSKGSILSEMVMERVRG